MATPAIDIGIEESARVEIVARTAREVFATADEAHDEPIADLLTERMQLHEKTAWMRRSLLE